MRCAVVGLGVQGRKRLAIAGDDVTATVDPVAPDAQYRTLADVPLSDYDAALVCTPDAAKRELIAYLLANAKDVLVEKPLPIEDRAEAARFAQLAASTGAICYTAYNHRFEPHFVRMKTVLDSGALGTIYSVRLFYGNGTARLVRDSAWRDTGSGVLHDLGSHLLDTFLFWFGKLGPGFRIWSASRFENSAFDHVAFGCPAEAGQPVVQMEATLLSWRNDFAADVLAERGSAHIRSLCKWGPSSFTLRRRVLPSGRPDDEIEALVQPDPTWQLEYEHFVRLCAARGPGNTANDLAIGTVLAALERDAV